MPKYFSKGEKMSFEGLLLLIKKKIISVCSCINTNCLSNSNFTIISNNCWGGLVYEFFDIIKQSPTIGLFFMAEEYLKFLSQFPAILDNKIVFINPKESKYYDYLSQDDRFGKYPIGKLGNVEICFLHYHSEEEARDKWERRCKRINYDRLLVKFSEQNNCETKHLKAFEELPFKNKICFVKSSYRGKSIVNIRPIIKNGRDISIVDEPLLLKKYINVKRLIEEL